MYICVCVCVMDDKRNVLRYALVNAMQSALPFSHATGSSIVNVVIVVDGCWFVGWSVGFNVHRKCICDVAGCGVALRRDR